MFFPKRFDIHVLSVSVMSSNCHKGDLSFFAKPDGTFQHVLQTNVILGLHLHANLIIRIGLKHANKNKNTILLDTTK